MNLKNIILLLFPLVSILFLFPQNAEAIYTCNNAWANTYPTCNVNQYCQGTNADKCYLIPYSGGGGSAPICCTSPSQCASLGNYGYSCVYDAYTCSNQGGTVYSNISCNGGVCCGPAPTPTPGGSGGGPYCGDGICNNGETCSSCSQDCGTCGGSGGGNVCPSKGAVTFSPTAGIVGSNETASVYANNAQEVDYVVKNPQGTIVKSQNGNDCAGTTCTANFTPDSAGVWTVTFNIWNGSCNPNLATNTVNVANAYNPPPTGWFDSASYATVAGWSCDASNYNQSINVDFYADGPWWSGLYLGRLNAGVYRQDLVNANVCGGTGSHGFLFNPWSTFNTSGSLFDGGDHTFYAFGIDIPNGNQNPQLGNPLTVTSRYRITGNMIEDDQNNGTNNPNGLVVNAPGTITVTDSGGAQVYSQTITNGTYDTGEILQKGTYTVALTLTTPNFLLDDITRTSYNVTIGDNRSGNGPAVKCTIDANIFASCSTNSAGFNASIQNLDFALTPTYRISGRIYNDVDQSTYYNAGADKPISTGSLTLNGPRNTNTNLGINSDGTYITPPIIFGSYTVTYVPPSKYHPLYPLSGAEAVRVGLPSIPNIVHCDADSGHNTDNPPDPSQNVPSRCDGTGSIGGLNFGITNEDSWFQGICTDLRDDNGFTDILPNNGTCDGTHSSGYAILPGQVCTNAGIVYSGTSNADFGPNGGQASLENYVVGGASVPQVFTPIQQNTIHDSFQYILDTQSGRGYNIPVLDLSAYCNIGSCVLPTTAAGFPSGIYKATGDVTIVGPYTFPANTSHSILVSGNLTITNPDTVNNPGAILVPDGSTAQFAAQGNIYFDPTVGEKNYTSYDATVEGWYISDKNIVIQRDNTLPMCQPNGLPYDKRLNLVGSFINSLGSNVVQNERHLCLGNATCPTYVMSQDIGNVSGTRVGAGSGVGYLLSTPDFLKHQNFFWQELPAVGN